MNHEPLQTQHHNSGQRNTPTSPMRPDADAIRWRILVVILIALFSSLVGVSIVNVALPAIQHSLDATREDIQWVLSGYALTFGVVLVAAGRAGDILGRGGIFLVGVALFTLASLAAGLAPDAAWLNGARFIQGVGSGLMAPQGIGMIQQYFRGADRGRAFGFLGTTVGFSVAIGPVLGGFLIELGGLDLGWRLTFLVNIPIGIITLILGVMWFPRPLMGRTTKKAPEPGQRGLSWSTLGALDPVGSLLLGLTVLAVLYPFVEARANPWTWLLIPVSAALLYTWIWWEKRYKRLGHSPMVDLKIFSTSSFTNGILIMSLYFLGMTSVWVLIALYTQEGEGKTALEAGLFGIPAALFSAYTAHWAGKRVMLYGRKIVVVGLLIGLFGLGSSIVVILMHEYSSLNIWWLLLTLSFIGMSQGLVISPNQALTLEDVPINYAGSSGAIMQTGQRIGTSVGIAVITAAAFYALNTLPWSAAAAIGFGVICLIVLVALGVAIKDLRERSDGYTTPH